MKTKTPRLLILIGAPCSGKTTFAKYKVRTHLNWVRVCRDDFRFMQFSQKFLSNEMEDAVTEMMFASIEKMLLRRINVMADATHTKSGYIDSYIERFGHLADIAFKVFDVPMEKLIERCNRRNEHTGMKIPLKALSHHVEALESLRNSFDFSLRRSQPRFNVTIDQDASFQKAIICDLDGTLALIDGRNPFDASNCGSDRLNIAVADILSYYGQNGHHILLVSGREEKYREETLHFLKRHNISFNELWMRPTGSYVKDNVLKRGIYKEYIESKYYVSLVLDDRDQVVDMWRKELQLPCFQVFYGQF